MSRRADLTLAAHGVRAFTSAGVLRPLPPSRVRAARRAASALHATPASSVAIGAALDPGGLAVADERERVTWRDLDQRARRTAAALKQRGAAPGSPVAVLCRNHAGLIVAIAAASRTGADVLALNTESTPSQIAATLAERSPAVVVHDAEFTERLTAAGFRGPRVLAWVDDERTDTVTLAQLAEEADGDDVVPSRRSQIIILTSGTTGVPKGASRDLPLRSLLGSIITLIDVLGLRRTGPVFVAPPLFHGFGLAFASIAQALGAPVVLRRRFDPADALRAVELERVHTFVAVPVMLSRLLAAAGEGADTTSLRAVVSAGAPLSGHLATQFMDVFGDVLSNAYGSTETGFGAIAGPGDLRAAPGTVGRPPLGGTVRILDADRRPAPIGATGHVFVGGDLVFEGYTAGGTKETADGGLMNTGDLGYVDDHGRLFISGREDDMIVSGGENVFPQEVEDALASHPQVDDVAVLGVPDEEFGQRLIAFVVPAADGSPTDADLFAHLREHVERYKLPREIVRLDEIPRTPTGKVLRRSLTP